MQYDVATITVRPGTAPKAIAKLEAPLTAGHAGRNLLACWYSEIGALNQILIIRNSPNLAEAIAELTAAAEQSVGPTVSVAACAVTGTRIEKATNDTAMTSENTRNSRLK